MQKMELKNKPDFEKAMKRIYAWYNQDIVDRVPIRFHAHNSEYDHSNSSANKKWNSLKERWFDAEYQIDSFIESLKGEQFNAETFPTYMPNLGPEVYSAFFGSELEYKEVTSYSIPLIKEWDDVRYIKLDTQNAYFKKIEELTYLAIEKCNGNYLVGYTDLHPGLDCVAAWRDPQQLCIDLLLNPDEIHDLVALATTGFNPVFNHFDNILKQNNHLSVTWMGIPSFEKMHIPSCDFAAMISPEQFEEFCLPVIEKEIKSMDQNIFHLDGKGVARHLDRILELKEINAIQWVQGMGVDTPIMQWVPLINKILDTGKSVVIDLEVKELDDFIRAFPNPKGLLLCISADQKIQPDIVKRIAKW